MHRPVDDFPAEPAARVAADEVVPAVVVVHVRDVRRKDELQIEILLAARLPVDVARSGRRLGVGPEVERLRDARLVRAVDPHLVRRRIVVHPDPDVGPEPRLGIAAGRVLQIFLVVLVQLDVGRAARMIEHRGHGKRLVEGETVLVDRPAELRAAAADPPRVARGRRLFQQAPGRRLEPGRVVVELVAARNLVDELLDPSADRRDDPDLDPVVLQLVDVVRIVGHGVTVVVLVLEILVGAAIVRPPVVAVARVGVPEDDGDFLEICRTMGRSVAVRPDVLHDGRRRDRRRRGRALGRGEESRQDSAGREDPDADREPPAPDAPLRSGPGAGRSLVSQAPSAEGALVHPFPFSRDDITHPCRLPRDTGGRAQPPLSSLLIASAADNVGRGGAIGIGGRRTAERSAGGTRRRGTIPAPSQSSGEPLSPLPPSPVVGRERLSLRILPASPGSEQRVQERRERGAAREEDERRQDEQDYYQRDHPPLLLPHDEIEKIAEQGRLAGEVLLHEPASYETARPAINRVGSLQAGEAAYPCSARAATQGKPQGARVEAPRQRSLLRVVGRERSRSGLS